MREERIPYDLENGRLSIIRAADGFDYVVYRDFVYCFLWKIGSNEVISEPDIINSLACFLP